MINNKWIKDVIFLLAASIGTTKILGARILIIIANIIIILVVDQLLDATKLMRDWLVEVSLNLIVDLPNEVRDEVFQWILGGRPGARSHNGKDQDEKY